MISIQQNIALKPFNTFGIEAYAKKFVTVETLEEIQWLIHQKIIKDNRLILGGGSNILLTKDFDGIVIHNSIKGISIVTEDEDHAHVKVGAGEIWHEFVLWSISNNLGGIENLSLIPGNVGASPMQNIGAYGVEIKDVFIELEAINIDSGETVIFTNNDCQFGYRESVFKNIYKDQYIITSVTYKLDKKHKFNTSYGAIEQELEKQGVKNLSIKAISDAVIAIRSSKLPDPKKIGNSGSFFKNPVVPNNVFTSIKKEHPSIASYPSGADHTKIAAGWLIEHAGWKGKTFNNSFGVHKNQALVLVNYGNAKGTEIYNLSEQIITSVKDKFNVDLQREVNIL